MNASCELTKANLVALEKNPYPGRGIILGLDETGRNLIQIYWIMGRSQNSRNRVFDFECGRLFTRPVDPAKMTAPELTLYNAMQEGGGKYVVSNGHQTDTVQSALGIGGMVLESALADFTYEPDEPNFTPRITGVCSPHGDSRTPIAELALLRKSATSTACERHFSQYYTLDPGYGHCITTYMGEGDPLPSFRGGPLLLPLLGNIEDIAGMYWRFLNTANRVSLAIKSIDRVTGNSTSHIINKFTAL